MKYFTSILLLGLSATILAHPTPLDGRYAQEGTGITVERAANATIDASLVPDFGVKTNTNPGAKQAGSCDGFAVASNAVTLIPCSCPPSRATFLAALQKNVAAGQTQGTPVKFSTDTADRSAATNRLRATAMLVTLQNLNGAGVGCPAASAPNFAVQQKTGTVSSKVFVG